MTTLSSLVILSEMDGIVVEKWVVGFQKSSRRASKSRHSMARVSNRERPNFDAKSFQEQNTEGVNCHLTCRIRRIDPRLMSAYND
jgi:hypothetical protein